MTTLARDQRTVGPVAGLAPEKSRATEIWQSNRWWIKRTALLPVHVFVFAIISFFIVLLIPGDPVKLVGGPQITAAQYATIQKALGLNGSVFSQLLTYLNNIVHLNFGVSAYSGKSVLSEFSVRLPATLELTLIAFVISIVFAVAASWFVLMRPRNVLSRILTAYSRTAGAIPQYLLAVAAIFIFFATLHWAPAPLGRMSPGLAAVPPITNLPLLDSILRGRFDATGSIVAHLTLPVLVLVASQADLLIKILVRALEEEVDRPSTWFRIASGVPRRIVFLSVFRRALPQLVVLLAAMFGFSLGGAVLLENLFSLGAMGQYAVDAINTKDIVALRGFLLFTATVSLIVFLIVDLVNMILDPRRRSDTATKGN
ncbi:ABC transporter permease [Frondihabitans cladoniiphilus]|uniref:ABC transporter permease n=1 Tax=Frondihabitans cladoniiphilus TaxID=715785 RepID=A0ABP8W6I6_9MICO